MALSTTAKVGLITLIGLILIGVVIVWKSEIFLIGRGYELVASFENIEGLTIGSEVRFRGLKVGKVMRVDPGPYDIKIYALVEPRIKIPDDSTLRVAYDGIVGLKFLEIRPGTSQALYAVPQELKGIRTAAIVDFVDIGSRNLEETKKIMENIRLIVENPQLQKAILNTVFTADQITVDLEKLTAELRETNKGIRDVVADPKFKENVKGIVGETAKTLTSANKFFESMSKLNLRASGGVDLGTKANAVRGDVDIIQSEKSYFRFGIGEGPTRQLSVLDFLLTNKMADDFSYRLGVINGQLGGGFIFQPNKAMNILTDIYDINNPKPNNPKLRLGCERELRDYLDLLLQADDVLNSSSRNISLGIRVKPPGEKIY